MFIERENFYDGWVALLHFLLDKGAISSPRGIKTAEKIGASLRITNGLMNILYHPIRNANYRFMVAEWLWIMSGSDDLETIAQYNSQWRQFSDDGKTLNGAYGKRIGWQVDRAVNKISYDKDTRQAVVAIWRPDEGDSKDTPCTVSLQFLVRENKLNLIVTMRSSDIWKGLTYDFYVFSQLLNCMAASSGVPVGFVQFNLGSSHVYEGDWEAGHKILDDFTGGACYMSRLLPGFPPQEIYSVLKAPQATAHFGAFLPKAWHQYASILVQPRKHAFGILTT